MKPRLKKCNDCDAVQLTCSQGIRCSKCQATFRFIDGRNALISQLENLGHTDIKEAGLTNYGKLKLSFTHIKCGTAQIWTIGNLKTRLKAYPDIAPCSKCGSKSRTKNAVLANKEKNEAK